MRTRPDGSVLRLRDVARVELGAESYGSFSRLGRKTATGIGIYSLPTANALDVAKAVRAEMDRLSKRFPSGLEYAIVYDTTLFVTESVRRGAHDPRRSHAARLPRGLRLPPELPRHAGPRHHGPGLAGGDLRADAGARLLDQHAHALRPGARDRPGGRRRDRGGRERGAAARGEAPHGQGGHQAGDARGHRADRRDLAGADGRVPPGGVPAGHHRPALSAVRPARSRARSRSRRSTPSRSRPRSAPCCCVPSSPRAAACCAPSTAGSPPSRALRTPRAGRASRAGRWRSRPSSRC